MKIRFITFLLVGLLGGFVIHAGCNGGGLETSQGGDGDGGGDIQPSVSSVSPSNGAAGVPAGQSTAITFSTAITEPSDWNAVFMLQQGGIGPNLCTSIVYDPATLTVTCFHDPLLAGLSYTETLTGVSGVADIVITFTVADASVLISPSDGSANVDPFATVSAVFSSAIQEPPDWASVFLLQQAGGASLCTGVTYNPATLTAICAHDPLLSGLTYTASLSAFTGVPSATSSFVIGSGIVVFSPGDGSVNVDPSAATTAAYFQPIAEPADWLGSFTLKRNNLGASLCTSVAYDAAAMTATCTHDTLISGGSYTLASSGIDGVPDSQATFAVLNASASFAPIDGSVGVDKNAVVTATFSGIIDEPADWLPIFELKRNGTGASLCTSVTYDALTRTATCVHGTLTAGANYVSSISGLAGVNNGQASFTVVNAGATLLPADGSVGINPTTPVTAMLSGPIDEPLDWTTVFMLQKNGTGASVCTSVAYDALALTATCVHDPMQADTQYMASISGLAGVNSMQATFTVSFANVTFIPADGDVDVDPATLVTATFSGPVAEPADWMAAFVLKKDGVGATLCTSVTYDAATFTATCVHAALTSGKSYTAAISGIAGVVDSQSVFTIKNASMVFSPADGSTNVIPSVSITAVFSGPIEEPVDWLSVLSLKKGGLGPNLCTSVTYDAPTLTATCVHDNLHAGKSYTAAVSGLAGATDGQASFTVKNVTVTFIPPDGATDVCSFTPVYVVFSDVIGEPSDWLNVFKLKKNGVGINRCISVTYDPVLLKATCIHLPLSDHNTSYTSSIQGIDGVLDSSATFVTEW